MSRCVSTCVTLCFHFSLDLRWSYPWCPVWRSDTPGGVKLCLCIHRPPSPMPSSRPIAELEECKKLAETFLQCAFKLTTPEAVLSVAVAVSSLFNKIENNEVVGELVLRAIEFIGKLPLVGSDLCWLISRLDAIPDSKKGSGQDATVHTCIGWITRAMVMRAHPTASSLATKLMQDLGDAAVGKVKWWLRTTWQDPSNNKPARANACFVLRSWPRRIT